MLTTNFTVATPLPGNWQCTVSDSGMTTDGLVLVMADSACALTPGAPALTIANAPLVLTATLAPLDNVSGVQATAQVTAPDSTVTCYSLNDSGVNGDVQAGDGCFSATLNVPAETGEYPVHYVLSGMLAGTPFRREADSSFSVLTPTGAVTALGPDSTTNCPDGVIDTLDIAADLTIPAAGDYQLTADLYDATGTTAVASLFGQATFAQAGANEMSMSVAGIKLHDAGIPGPFQVCHTVLWQLTDGATPVPIGLSAESFTTQYYPLTSFDHAPVLVSLTPTANSYVVNGTAPIVWQATDADDPDARVSLYYDTTGSGYQGTLIANDLPLSGEYDLQVSTLPMGVCYVYAVVDDGICAPVEGYAAGSLTHGNGVVIGAKVTPQTTVSTVNQTSTFTIQVAHSLSAAQIASVTFTAGNVQVTVNTVQGTVSLWDQTSSSWLTGTIGTAGMLNACAAGVDPTAVSFTCNGQLLNITLPITANQPMAFSTIDITTVDTSGTSQDNTTPARLGDLWRTGYPVFADGGGHTHTTYRYLHWRDECTVPVLDL